MAIAHIRLSDLFKFLENDILLITSTRTMRIISNANILIIKGTSITSCSFYSLIPFSVVLKYFSYLSFHNFTLPIQNHTQIHRGFSPMCLYRLLYQLEFRRHLAAYNKVVYHLEHSMRP